MDKGKLHSLCGCSTTELNKSIKVVKATCDKTIIELKNQSTSTARTSRRTKGSIKETEEEETKEKGKLGDKKKVTQSKKRKASIEEEPVKPRIKPVSGIVSMINHQDYLKTKRYAEYKKWKSDLIRDIITKKM